MRKFICYDMDSFDELSYEEQQLVFTKIIIRGSGFEVPEGSTLEQLKEMYEIKQTTTGGYYAEQKISA